MKKLVPIFISLVCLVLIFNLSRQIYRLSKAQNRLNQAQEKLNQQKIVNWQLLQEKNYRQTETFLEKEVRDKLMMAKKEETILILPEEIVGQASVSASQQTPVSQEIWQEWLEIFL